MAESDDLRFYEAGFTSIEGAIESTDADVTNEMSQVADGVVEDEVVQADVTEIIAGNKVVQADVPDNDVVIGNDIAQINITSLGNTSTLTQGHSYQMMAQASIQSVQNVVNLQQQLGLNSSVLATQNLNFIYARKGGKTKCIMSASTGMVEVFRALYPESAELVIGEEASNSQEFQTHSKRLKFLNSVLEMLKTLQNNE